MNVIKISSAPEPRNNDITNTEKDFMKRNHIL